VILDVAFLVLLVALALFVISVVVAAWNLSILLRDAVQRCGSEGIDMGRLLRITSATPNYVRRAQKVIWREFSIDLCAMPQEDWAFVLVAAVDNANKSNREFDREVCEAMETVCFRRFGQARADK